MDLSAFLVAATCCGTAIRPVQARFHSGEPMGTNQRSRTTAALLALFLGGLGIHKFYLGRIGWGIVYLLLCWTFIPLLVGIVEGVFLLMMSDDEFPSRYGARATSVPDSNPGTSGALEATQLVLRDRHGRARLQLGTGNRDMPYIALFDPAGLTRMSLMLESGDNPSVGLMDRAGQLRILMRVDSDGSSRFAFTGTTAEDIALCLLRESDGAASVILGDSTGNPRADISFDGVDIASIRLTDASRSHQAVARAGRDGAAFGVIDGDSTTASLPQASS
jgi:TM2 domain-containing membrane protein YozV